MRIDFCGASSSVTGSCHLITTKNHKILLDCGQFQGGKALETKNFEPFPFEPKEIECVILSHAHIDHCGRLPLLVKRGFTGKIYCTDATADLLDVMLKDSAYIHEKDAEYANKKADRQSKPHVEPLYTVEDSVATLDLVVPVLYDQLIDLGDGIHFVLNEAGHILGSAITELWIPEDDGNVSKLVFSGDLGVMDRPILRNPKLIKKADYLIMETTYGNRLHPENSMSVKKLIDIVLETTDRGGTVVIPAFAVGRTQELIYEFNRFYEDNSPYREKLDKLNVYVDSPMATTATEVFRRNAQVFDDEAREYIMRGDNPLDFKNLKFTRSTAESQYLNTLHEPKIIISASGMCEAGRIRHHLKHNLWDARNSIIFVGYQAEGSLGRLLVEGAPEVMLFGEVVKVNAQIHNLEGFSGHADMTGLLSWLSGFQQEPKKIFLVHGEEDSKKDFADTVRKKLGYTCEVVHGNSSYDLTNKTVMNEEEAMKDAMDDMAIMEIRDKLSAMHDGLEKILYNTSLAMGSEASPERLAEINNLVLELEKATLNLGSTVTKEENDNIDVDVPENPENKE